MIFECAAKILTKYLTLQQFIVCKKQVSFLQHVKNLFSDSII